MAEAILLGITEGIIANLASEPLKKFRLPLSYKDEFRKLQLSISTIRAVLLDAEAKQATNEQVKLWLERLEDAIYDADNLVDRFRCEQLRRKVVFGKKRAKKVRIFFSSSNQIVFRVNMANKIKQIRKILDEINEDRRNFNLEERLEERHIPSPMSWRETHSFETDDEVIGRDGDKSEIIGFLLDNNIESVPIISIVGIGGLGKTTLARLVYNDELVKKNFVKRMWVCVSDNFELKLLIQKIIRSATDTNPDSALGLELDRLQEKLREEIQGKKYLLVLDDVWNEDVHKWDEIKKFLNLGAKGSRVLITTRSIRVAEETTNSTRTHRLRGLDEHKSRTLFEKVAFKNINETNHHPHLVEIGKDIVSKCEGVPLAIKTIGTLLHSKSKETPPRNLATEWSRFRDTELAELHSQNQSDKSQNQSGILPTLKLSYNNLPSHLKKCFAYCSLFPKDHEINVGKLIRLWIAQGFIKPIRNSRLEDIGYGYFMTLLWGCFFQEAKTGKLSSNTIESCKMHDLMHDLATLVAGKRIRILDESTNSTDLEAATGNNPFEKIHHMFVDCSFTRGLNSSLFIHKKIRTFILHEDADLSSLDYDGVLSNFNFLRALTLKNEDNYIKLLPNNLGKLKHLRYLDLSNNYLIKELPNSMTELFNLQTLLLRYCRSLVSLPPNIQNLINLRHLDLSNNYEIEELPNSITELSNLQTLILCDCRALVSLPPNIQGLVNLRHLEILGCRKLTHLPRGIGELTSLETLDYYFIVGDNNDVSSESCGFGELGNLQNLHGGLTISISRLGEKATSESGTVKCLKGKEHLESLVVDWKLEAEYAGNAEEAFEGLEPPRNIKSIKVKNYPGETFPNWLSSLTNLVHLKITKFTKCKYLPPLHRLSSLQELEIDSLPALEYVLDCDSSKSSSMPLFPSLTEIEIINCSNLKGWWRRETEDLVDDDEGGDSRTEYQQQQSPFPNLSHLRIISCPVLTSMPLFPNLEELTLYSTSSKPLKRTIMMKSDNTRATSSTSSSFSPLSKLKHLTIEPVDDLESPLLEKIFNLSSLTRLEIGCRSLTSLPEGIGSLSSLTMLIIRECDSLTSLPEVIGSLSSLTNLLIDGCDSLTSLPQGIGSLSSLTNLSIRGCDSLTSLPEGIGTLSSLTDLIIEGCGSLTSLPEGINSLPSLEHSLPSLEWLRIHACAKLTMPDAIRHHPAFFRNTSISKLNQ